ncbi:hypothetical protein [Evansella clarkii]|uniref:hypothetical protein n=1 Tax=Evansella clarkii TaxID=79879 RepID=UPI000B445246|nr:hypothetical protein [Evansella clarkii]
MRPVYFIAGLTAIVFLAWGVIYFQNSAIEKVSARNGAIEILEMIDTGGGIFVLANTGDFISGEIYEKGLLGWKAVFFSQAVNDRKNETIIRPESIGYVSDKNMGFHYGYADGAKVEAVKFQADGMEMSSKVNSHFWVIPALQDGSDGSFIDSQFSAILKDGTEVYHPFEEIN